MHIDDHSQVLLKKFILNQCTKAEVDIVIAYFQKTTKSNQLPSVKNLLLLLEEKPILNEVDANRIYDNIINTIPKHKKLSIKRSPPIWRYAVAASILFLVSLGFLFNKKNTQQLPIPIIVKTIDIGKDKATLTLGNGAEIALEKGEAIQTTNATSNGEKITYKIENKKAKEVEFNYLSVPRGGQFQITLSDGTHVWLNSESQIKFPVSFTGGEARKVELLYGEAYFDVSPSTNHKGSKFIVINQSQEVEVLGTEFNIKAYKGESNIYTTLVEGKVSISSSGINKTLKPNEQSNLNLKDNSIAIAKVNIYNEVSWKVGVFSFHRKSLKDIMTVLSRWYDIKVEFVNPEIKEEGFNGVLSKDQNIEDILKVIKSYGIIKNYKIENKTVTLK